MSTSPVERVSSPPGMLLLVESYDEIAPCLKVLTQALSAGRPVRIIVVFNANLHKFFTVLNERRLDGAVSVSLIPRTVGRSVCSVFRQRSELRRLWRDDLHAVRDSDVVFFTRYSNPATHVLLRRLAACNRLTLMAVFDLAAQIRPFRFPVTLNEVLFWGHRRLTYGRPPQLIRYSGKLYEYIPDRFISKHVDIVSSAAETAEFAADVDLRDVDVFGANQFRLIYFDQPLDQSGRVTSEEFRTKLTRVFEVIGAVFEPHEVGIKYHPMLGSTEGVATGTVIEDHVPAEMLYDDGVQFYVSFSSGSIARARNGVVISLLDLMTFRDDEAKHTIKSRLVERAVSEVCFPGTFEELAALLRGRPESGSKAV